VTRRIVSAPYDGILELTYAESGDIVSEGELLARMDAREIRWELSTATAEHSQAVKQFDSELAAENIAKAQLAKMEAERLKRKQELLRHREENHELKAPMNGMVLNGSVDKLNGAAVRMGQPLFEVAELNPLRLELSVPAEDYFHVRPGQSVSVSFDDFDGETLEGQIVRIRPRSEVRNDKNVFIAELEVPSPDLRLRPGIDGSATIIGDKHSIAWNTFHKAWEALWRTDPTTILTDSRSDLSRSSSTTSVATRMEDHPLLTRRTGDRTQVASEFDEATESK
jgi:RND family efflux transporter MFP subunit